MEKVKLNKSQDHYNLYDYMMNMQNKKFFKHKNFQTSFINAPTAYRKYSKDDIRHYNKRENRKYLTHISLSKNGLFKLKAIKI